VRLVIVLDCREPVTLAQFWAKALGYRQSSFKDPYLALVPPEPGLPELLLQRVPEPKTGKNRMHLDLRIEHLQEERDRLLALGALQLSDDIVENGFRWYVMADPEGNEFCVIQEPSIRAAV
jgi:catechol 2,3-dioxygenase-like lactoylglutathione lyase family enzyme